MENVLPAAVGSMILKMQFLNQGPGDTIILQLARHWLLFFENHKNSSTVVLSLPGGMRRGAARRYEEGSEICKFDLRNLTLVFGLTRQLCSTRQAADFLLKALWGGHHRRL